MRVLVACEYSGKVRDAFAAAGHYALSCDLLETDRPGGNHYTGDVLDVLDGGWDLMVAHPPCTYLTNSGALHLYQKLTKEERAAGITKRYARDETRWENMAEGAKFFNMLAAADIPRIAVENPTPHGHARRLIGAPTQYIQPWEHGHPESKATGLWLKNLPPLQPSNNVYEHMMTLTKQERQKVHRMPPGPDRWKKRSTTFDGIAQAMADQWGNLPPLR